MCQSGFNAWGSVQQAEAQLRHYEAARQRNALRPRSKILQYVRLDGEEIAVLRDGTLRRVVEGSTRVPVVRRSRYADPA
jgi:hypothetical protein